MAVIKNLAQNANVTVGVGTILTADQGRAAIDAGASFVVSPAFIPGLSEAGETAGVPVALGAATPTECGNCAHRSSARRRRQLHEFDGRIGRGGDHDGRLMLGSHRAQPKLITPNIVINTPQQQQHPTFTTNIKTDNNIP